MWALIAVLVAASYLYGAIPYAYLGTYLATGLWWIVAALCLLSVVSYTRIGIAFVAETDQKNQQDGGDGPG